MLVIEMSLAKCQQDSPSDCKHYEVTPAGKPEKGGFSTLRPFRKVMSANSGLAPINYSTDKYPFCLVWTPIPVLTWFFPFIGHMGIALSNGVIRDFAGPYYVSEDNMAFGRPTRYLLLDPYRVEGGPTEWDEGVSKASVVYGTRMHNLFCDNCHSHVAMALNTMKYKSKTSYNMILLAFWMFFCGQYVGFCGFLKTWLPFLIVIVTCTLLALFV